MSSPLPVRIVSSAARAIADAAEWWRTNRPDAPDAFITDLENSFKLIASHPDKERERSIQALKACDACTWRVSTIISTTA